MSTKYHKLKVKQIVRETPDTISIYFKQPFFSKIRYKPGQFLTLLVPINGQVERRSYSMSSCPHTEDELCVTVKRVSNGKVSNYLNDHLKPGQELEVMEPMGSFHLDLHPVQRHVVLIGAGSGITPLMSIAKAVLRMEATSIVSLLYGNRSEDSIIFKETLDKLQNQFPGRFQVFHILSRPSHSWTGYRGRLSQTLATKLLNELPKLNVHKMDYYLCGPQEMMEEMQKTLLAMQVPAEKIHKESFVTTPAAATTKPEAELASPSVIKTEEVTLRFDGSEYKIKVSPNKTILEAGLDSGLDLPYSCQSGLCTACRGKRISGKVKMDEEDGLSPQEMKDGYVLPCVSHPLSPDVVIEIG